MRRFVVLFSLLSGLTTYAQQSTLQVKIIDERGKNIPHCQVTYMGDSSLRMADNDAIIAIDYNSSSLDDSLWFRSIGHYDTFSTIRALVKDSIVVMARYAYSTQQPLGDHMLRDTILGDQNRKIIESRWGTTSIGTVKSIKYRVSHAGAIRLNGFSFYIGNYTDEGSSVRLRIFQSDKKSRPVINDLLDTLIIVPITQKNTWYTVDSLNYWVWLPEKSFFVGLEVVNPEVDLGDIPWDSLGHYVELGVDFWEPKYVTINSGAMWRLKNGNYRTDYEYYLIQNRQHLKVPFSVSQ